MDEAPNPDDPELSAEEAGARFVRFGLFFYGAMMAAALVWRMGLHGESILYATPEDAARGVDLVRDTVIGTVAGFAVVLASSLLTRLTRWGDDLARSLAAELGFISVPDALLVAVASGMGEELFFRGALQPRVGLVVASLLFGCVHFVPRRELLPWTGFAVVAGVLFGWLFIWTGNVVAPIVAHIVVNGVNLPLLVRRYRPVREG
jgi:membrane protease YdiL (CAAX protease family)